MRHIDPKDSTVFQEFERMAAEKGWIVQAALDAGMADQIRKEVNAVASMLPKTNAVLDLLIPIAETGGDNTELRHALDALRASVMDPFLAQGFDEQGGEARSLYHSARSMLHAPEGQGHLWLNGLRSFRELLSKHYGQTVEKSKPVPQEVDTELAPAEMAADTGFIEGGSPKWPEPDVMTKSEIKRLWDDLDTPDQRAVLAKTKAPRYVAPGTPHFYTFFARPENLKVLRDAPPSWLEPDVITMQKRMVREQEAPGAPEGRAPASSKWFVSPLVGQVQKVLMGLGGQIGAKRPDNAWGPLTNTAWNAVVKRYGLERYGLKMMPRIFPGDQSSPSLKEMEFMVEHGPALAVIERPGQGKPAPAAGAAGPAEVETGPMPPEHIPTGYADDGLLETAAAVTRELVALANDLDAMGSAEAAEAVDAQLKLYKEAADKLYDITGETGEQLIGKAHPGGGPTVAPAQEEGGKVETIVEEHKKVREKATKPPTGKQAAFVAQQLVALANRLDGEGKREAAMLVDKTLDELRRASRRPFVRNLRKEGVDAGELTMAFQQVAEHLESIASDVQDQTFLIGAPSVRWGSRNYEKEYDEFCEDARVFFEQAARFAPQYASNPVWVKRIVQRVAGLVPALEIVRNFYLRKGGSTRALGDWTERSSFALKGIKEIAAKFKGEVPKMEAGKLGPEKTPKTPKGGIESQRLQSTVSRIITSIERAQKEDRELLDATFKRATIPGVSGKSGIEKALKTLAIVKKLKGRAFDEVKSLRYNNWLWNRIVSLLRRAALLKGAAAKAGLTKKAAEEAPPGFGGTPARRGRGRGRGKTERQDIMVLQGLMDKLNYDLGSAGVDGKWGPKTAAAWERLRKEVAAMKGPALPPAAPAKSAGPAANAVRLAAQVASYLLSVRGEPAKAVNLAPGIRVPESALASPQTFIGALARVPASGVRFVGPRDMFSKENLAKASDLLSKYREGLRQPGNPEAWNIWTKGGGAPALKRRVRIVDALLAQLPRAGTRVPPMGYEYEGGTARLPFGTLEGGPGMPGYKPGKPGEAGSVRGRPGYSEFFSPRGVVLEASQLLPDDLLDAMANTRQFIWYANYPGIRNVLKHWRGQGRNIDEIRGQLKRGKRDKKAIALTYIEFLRDRLGKLRRRLAQVGERRLGADAQKIKDRIMLAVSYMSTLEDDLRYGAL